ncbi:MAG: peptidoglycan-binding protein [Clostridiales bacterium]|nr:peptidoglycan-binding protein [Clostridiales bacterium]
MKKIVALLISIIIAAAFCAAPTIASSTANSAMRIYDKTSTGSMVVRIQIRLRELGYLNFKPTGSYKSMTVNAVKDFQSNYRDSGYEMQVDGKMGPQSLELLFKYDAKRVSLNGVSIPAGPKHGSDTLVKTGSLLPWASVRSMLVPGKSYTITDCYTGKVFELVFSGGDNHAEMEPASEAKLADFKEICGKEYNFLKRPVVVEIDGQEVAASIQCWPHGEDTIGNNGMTGHVCLFFDGSTSNVGRLPDVEHTENIYKASGQ